MWNGQTTPKPWSTEFWGTVSTKAFVNHVVIPAPIFFPQDDTQLKIGAMFNEQALFRNDSELAVGLSIKKNLFSSFWELSAKPLKYKIDAQTKCENKFKHLLHS